MRPFEDAISADDANRMAEGLALLAARAEMRETVVDRRASVLGPVGRKLRDRFRWTMVYDWMDDHAGLGRRASWMPDFERRLAVAADLTVVTSNRLRGKM